MEVYKMRYKGYRVNEPIKTKFYICNCVYGHQNCQCDGKGNKKMKYRKCIECGQHLQVFNSEKCEECQ